HLGADDDGVARAQLAEELDVDLQDGRPGPGAADGVDAEAARGDQVPARLLHDLQIAGVVDVPERIQVQLADDDRLLVNVGHAYVYNDPGSRVTNQVGWTMHQSPPRWHSLRTKPASVACPASNHAPSKQARTGTVPCSLSRTGAGAKARGARWNRRPFHEPD